MPNKERDTFDDLAIPVTKLDVMAMLGRSKKKERTTFVALPMTRVKRLENAKLAVTYRLAIFLHYRNWKQPGEPVTVSNVALRGFGSSMSRWQKDRALCELESLS
jgi:hypothetical protein